MCLNILNTDKEFWPGSNRITGASKQNVLILLDIEYLTINKFRHNYAEVLYHEDIIIDALEYIAVKCIDLTCCNSSLMPTAKGYMASTQRLV